MNKTKRLALASLFCAFCCIGTMIHVPAGPTLGYVHLGDAFVLLSGILLGPVTGGLAAAIGSALADLINGYAIWIPGTFIIKGLCAVICGLFFNKFWIHSNKKNHKKLHGTIILSGFIAECVMILGYFAYEILLLVLSSGGDSSIGVAVTTSLLNVPFNVLQAIAAIILTLLLVPILLRLEDVRNLMNP